MALVITSRVVALGVSCIKLKRRFSFIRTKVLPGTSADQETQPNKVGALEAAPNHLKRKNQGSDQNL